MNRIIIYGSQYGTARCYAQELSKRTGIQAVSYETEKDLSEYDTVILIGGLYAGGVKGLKDTVKRLPDADSRHIVIITVGLADVTDQSNVDHIRSSIQNQIPDAVYQRAEIFHLRGGIDYNKLSFLHKTMMTILCNKVKKIPEVQRTAEQKDMIATFNQKVDFVDFETLNPIIAVLQ